MKLDSRYKVNEEIVLKILNLRGEGWKFQNIADEFNLNVSTVYYWGNADYRQKQREKNRKRVAATGSDLAKARKYAKIRYYKKSKAEHLRDRISKRCKNNCIVYGKKRSYWQLNFPHYFEAIPNAKLDKII